MIGRRTRLLSRTFFGRMFENDLFSGSASASTSVMWLLAALATPGVMFSGSQYYFYAHARTFNPELQDRILFVSQVFHVDFAMAAAALMTMLIWTSIAPDRRDALVLGPLPIGVGEHARARLLALGRLFVLFALAVAVPTAVAFTFVTVGDGNAGEVPARIAGHISATMMGAGFVFFVLIAAHLILAVTLGPRATAIAGPPLQVAAVLAMVAAISATGRLADALLNADAADSAWLLWNPATWFVGVYRWIAGDARDIFVPLAVRGVTATAAVMALALLVYPAAYRRSVANAIAMEGRRDVWWTGVISRLWLRVMAPLLPRPLERGIAAFIVANLTRSHTHRFLLGSYAGCGLLSTLPLTDRLLGPAESTAAQYAWFAVPLGFLCWLAAGARVAMMLPVEPASNWIFKLTEPVDKTRVLSTVVVVMHGAISIPLAVTSGVAAGITGGIALGLSVCVVVLAAGAALIELLTLLVRAVPGTCTYRPGQLRLRVLWPLYLGVWLSIGYGVPRLAVDALGHLPSTASLVGILIAVAITFRTIRRRRARNLQRLVFEELDPPTTTTMDLHSAIDYADSR